VNAAPRAISDATAMTASDRRFEPLGGRIVYEGRIVSLSLERYRYPDGEEVEREVIRHQGAVGIVAHDGSDVFLVRQPREAIDDPDFLEIPAGRLDVEGEAPLEAAQRELAEEIGKAGGRWEHLTDFVSSVGVMDEVVHVFLATGLSDAHAEAEHNERIEIVRWPLADLDGAIAATRDAKTLIGLLMLKTRR
jgi:8-oxo-dGTP pyrophosphatase MutT (NUDIX family)